MFEKINKTFDDEVKTSSVAKKNETLDFEEYLIFLEYVLKNFSIDNMDIINRVLNHLETNSKKEIKGVLEKCDRLNNIKRILQSKLEEKRDNYKEEKESINNYNYILKKLEKIEINLSEKVEIDFLEEYDDVFDYLLERLNRIIVNFSERNVDAVYIILELLEK